MATKIQLDPQLPDRAVIVARVSSEGQTDGTSLDGQLSACYAEAQKRVATVAAVYTEVVSGALYLARPDMQQALQDIEEGRANLLIVAKLDRAGRDVTALRDIRRRVIQAGGQMVFADGLQIDNNPLGNLMFTQLGAFAEFERELIKERTTKGKLARAMQGVMPTRSKRPYGYRFVSEEDVKAGTHLKEQLGQYLIVENQAVIIRELYTRYDNGQSLRSLAQSLENRGVATASGWGHWQQSTISLMLRNSIYRGTAYYRKKIVHLDESRAARGKSILVARKRPFDQLIAIPAPALVDNELWDRVQERLGRNRTLRAGRPTQRHLLTGLLRCPQCHRRMSYRTRKRVHRKTKAPMPSSTSYQCRNDQQAGEGFNCDQRAYSAKKLEALVLQGLNYVWQRPELLELAVENYQYQRKSHNNQSKRESLQRELEKLAHREIEIADLQIEARLAKRSDAAYCSLMDKLTLQRQALEDQLKTLTPPLTETFTTVSPDALLSKMAEQVELVLQSEQIPLNTKNALLGEWVINATPIGTDGADMVLLSPYAGHSYFCRMRDGVTTVSLEKTALLPRFFI